MDQNSPARSSVIDLTDYLARRRGSDHALVVARQELPSFARAPDRQHERQLAHRRRMLEHLEATARGYA